MDDLSGLAQLIVAITGMLGLIGAGLWKIVQFVVNRYQDQVEKTEKAKNDEIAAAREEAKQLKADKEIMRQTAHNQSGTILEQVGIIASQNGEIARITGERDELRLRVREFEGGRE